MSQNPSPLPVVLAAALALAAGGALAQDAPLSTALTPPPLAATNDTPAAPAPAPEQVPLPPPAASAPIFAAPAPVETAPLSAPDLFAADAGTPTGLPSDLWNGASLDLARTVIPMAVTRPMTPAAQAFAIHVMSTASSAPDGGGADADLAAARIYVVLSLGDPIGARAMLQHTPGVRQSAAMSQVAAEADLVLGRDDEACSLGDTLAVGKDSAYFRRLRVFCLVKGGDKPGAQLAYDLTSEQAKDDVYKHLMSAAVSGQTAGVQASLRNGLEYALSRLMGLDPTPVMDKAWAPIATMLALDAKEPAALQAAAAAMMAKRQIDMNRAASLNPAVMAAAQSLADDKLDPTLAERLAAGGVAGSAEEQQGLALYAAAGAPGAGRVRAAFAGFDIGGTKANQARMLELDAVSSRGAKGDVALLALWLMMDAGEAGPSVADRSRIIRAMDVAGFGQDARRYALEGLLYLKTPPAVPTKAAAPPPKASKKAPPPKPVHKPRKKAEPSSD
jgi:hypothetical protein